MSRIYIVGFMGVGKSTVGKKLASSMGYTFIDTDKIFENKYKLSIGAFFEKYGEELFRKLEHEILLTTFDTENCVISTGGGLPCYNNAIKEINRNGVSIFLELSENAIYSRLAISKQKRPLIQELNEEELRATISHRLKERSHYYNEAKIHISGLSVDISELIEEVSNFI